MEVPQKKTRWPWWAWLLILLFPIPIGVVPRWVAAIFMIAFALVIWAMVRHFEGNTSQ